MTEQTGYRLLIANFTDEAITTKAVKRLLAEFKGDRAAMPAAALVTKDPTGKLTIRETADVGAKQGAAAGALVGGLVGLLSRKRGALGTAALGALLGGAAAHKLDTGIPDPRLEAIGAALDEATGAAVGRVSGGRWATCHAQRLYVYLAGAILEKIGRIIPPSSQQQLLEYPTGEEGPI